MLEIGKTEAVAASRIIRGKKLFRYVEDAQCARFEKRYGEFLGVPHVCMTSSGTASLTAVLAAMGLGPGDEVVVPAHTYMATALAVLAVGAIPVIADVDASIMLDPEALDDIAGPRTKAVIPVHMWGQLCDMDPILRIARRHKLKVVEDACQCVGGSYKGRMAGAIGHAGAFSFNVFKNMTCGEGGAAVTADARVASRIRGMVDPCSHFWTGRSGDTKPFAASGSRASEIEGAIMNAQLDRLPDLLVRLRRIKKTVLDGTVVPGLTHAPRHSPDGECATYLFYQLPDTSSALRFAELAGGGITANTGRHTFTEWDPVLNHRGAIHPAMDPYRMPQNKGCRMNYGKTLCRRSLEILKRTVMIGLRYNMTQAEIRQCIRTIREAAVKALSQDADESHGNRKSKK